jgi:hypothetical protein
LCRLSVKAEWLIATRDKSPYSLEVLCGLTGIMGTLVEIETVGGQLGESGEYWMGRRMSGLLSIQSSKVVPLPMSIKARVGWVKMNNL